MEAVAAPAPKANLGMPYQIIDAVMARPVLNAQAPFNHIIAP
jgi:hypothetical protein